MSNHKSKTNKKSDFQRSKENSKTDWNLQNNEAEAIYIPSIQRDDLLKIESIKPITEMALNSIGIRQFSDFQNYTPLSLSKALQTRAGIAICAEIIESQKWIEHAQLLAEKKASQNNFEIKNENLREKSEGNMSGYNGEHFSVDSNEKEKGKMIETDLEGSEQSNKQTRRNQKKKRPHKKNNSKTQEARPVHSSKSLQQFDSNQNNPLINQEQKQQKDSDEEVSLQIKDAKFHQIETPVSTVTTAKKMMYGEISCDLIGTKVKAISDGKFPICIQIYAVNMATNETKLMVCKSFPLKPEQHSYKIYLEFNVAEVGYYRLNTVVFLLYSEPKIDIHQGPFLRVIM